MFGWLDGTDTFDSVTVVSADRMPDAIVTLLPSGRVIVPPADAMIVWETLAIVPATMTGDEADFVVSVTLVAVSATVNGVGTVAGAV